MQHVRKKLLKLATAPIFTVLPILAALALLLNFTVEALGRQSVFEAAQYMTGEPLMFLCNWLIILFTLSLCLLTRHRLTLLLLLSTIWLALGMTNFIVLSYRSSPLSAIDFLIVRAAMGMITIYFSVIQIILIAALILAFIATLVMLLIKCPRCQVSFRRSFTCVLVIGLTVWGATAFATATAAIEYESGELSEAYSDYGFAYCFTQSILSQGVERPDGYTPVRLDELIDSLQTDSSAEERSEEAAQPNIIFVQLESFFDVSQIHWMECSEDPTPSFNAIKENGVSGYLRVANIGGGTANTEFEVLTGMNLDHFGFGEYPYTTVLKERACESIAANLSALGYSTHALHNHIATFYDRNIVYANLGFDTFTPIEMMTGITRNPLGWARDEVLTNEILSALDSTESADFVFAVTVQGHGKYPDEPLDDEELERNVYLADDNGIIDVYGVEDKNERSQYMYYVNQLRETDLFIGELTAALAERDEPCVVVFYGDHMPALALTNEDIASGDMYQTEYAVWSNIPMQGDANEFDRDLEAYQLSAYIQQLYGMSGGSITMLHQRDLENGSDSDEELRMIEYAQLYDTDTGAYSPTDIHFGTRPVSIEAVTISGNTLYITGSGFNEYSVVRLDGYERNTLYMDEHTLAVENIFFKADTVEVVQMASGIELSSAQINT